MTHDPGLPPGLRHLGEQLHAAAEREVQADRRRGRRPRRVLMTGLAAVLLLTAVASAATLIATGIFVHDRPGMPHQLKPAARGATRGLAVSVPDPGASGAWGARVYTSRAGYACAVAGWISGASLGIVDHSRFRPYAADVTGACGDLTSGRFFLSLTLVNEPAIRTLVYGRAQPGVARVQIDVGGSAVFAVPGPGGAFLFVVPGHRTLAELQPRG